MIRYFALAALIVLTVAVAATAWVNRDVIRIKIASTTMRGSGRTDAPTNGRLGASQNAFTGDAPWALSALPECVEQLEQASGTAAYVNAHLPADAVAIAPPATFAYGDCTISLVGVEAMIRRGPDRFRIPPVVRFYRADDRLVVLRSAAGRSELRIYQRSSITSQ